MKTRVLAISHMYPTPHDEFDGLVIHEQARELIKRGVDVKVIAPIPWAPFPVSYLRRKWRGYAQTPLYSKQDGIDAFRPRYLEFPKAFLYAFSGYRMHFAIKGIADHIYRTYPFHLIHAHMALPDGYAAMLLARRYQKPLITTFRMADIDVTIHKNRQCFRAVEKVSQSSARIIAPSPRLSQELYRQMGISSEVISSGIHREEIFTGTTSLSKRYHKDIIILSASRLIKTKGIDLNLKAVAALKDKYPDIRYLVIGDGEERAALERAVNDLSLQNEVEFLGWLPHQKVMEYMSICSIFSLPSYQETLGLVYLEAMAHGKAVIGCVGQGVDGIIIDGETGLLIKPRDEKGLLCAMDLLLANHDKANEIGQRARKLVLKNYTWEKNVKKHIEIYEELLEHAR
jgi:glycosyltransferase involved in cell wall biosynthesis